MTDSFLLLLLKGCWQIQASEGECGLSGRCPETAASERWLPRPSLSLCCSLSLWAVGEEKKGLHIFIQFLTLASTTWAKVIHKAKPRQWEVASLEASPQPISARFLPAVAYYYTIPLPSWSLNLLAQQSGLSRAFQTGPLGLSLILKLNSTAVGDRFRGTKAHTNKASPLIFCK